MNNPETARMVAHDTGYLLVPLRQNNDSLAKATVHIAPNQVHHRLRISYRRSLLEQSYILGTLRRRR